MKGQMLARKLLDPNTLVSHELECSAINYAMDVLYKENKNKLNFGANRNALLHIVGRSLVMTFPRLKTEIREGENVNWEHVSGRFKKKLQNFK